MYSYNDRMKAVLLYIKYDFSAADVVYELGYPSRKMLVRWYKEYLESGNLHERYIKQTKYSLEQKKKAVNYYLEHGRSLSRTIRAVGYPTREVLTWWIDELAPGNRKKLIKRHNMVQFSYEQKKDAVVELTTRDSTATVVAEAQGVTRETLYAWRRQLCGEEHFNQMKRDKHPPLPDDKEELLVEIESLRKRLYRQQLELDVLVKAAEIIKKDQGIDPTQLTNKEKTILIDALRKNYPLKDLLEIVSLPKSSYFYQRKVQGMPDKYADLRKEIKGIFLKAKRRYGYRRICSNLKTKASEKVIRRIMTEEQLVAKGRKKRRYSSYVGEVSPAVSNIIDRDFYADTPNAKWLTDITEFHIPAGKIYLSPIIDCFDGMAVSWTIGTSPNADLVNTMLDGAISVLDKAESPVIHSDRGGHYRWPGWIERMDKAQLTRSMSKKGCSPDNAACEGFFGRLKNEMYYDEDWTNVSISEFVAELDEYLIWYNEERSKTSLGGMSPLQYRHSIGLVS